MHSAAGWHDGGAFMSLGSLPVRMKKARPWVSPKDVLLDKMDRSCVTCGRGA